MSVDYSDDFESFDQSRANESHIEKSFSERARPHGGIGEIVKEFNLADLPSGDNGHISVNDIADDTYVDDAFEEEELTALDEEGEGEIKQDDQEENGGGVDIAALLANMRSETGPSTSAQANEPINESVASSDSRGSRHSPIPSSTHTEAIAVEVTATSEANSSPNSQQIDTTTTAVVPISTPTVVPNAQITTMSAAIRDSHNIHTVSELHRDNVIATQYAKKAAQKLSNSLAAKRTQGTIAVSTSSQLSQTQAQTETQAQSRRVTFEGSAVATPAPLAEPTVAAVSLPLPQDRSSHATTVPPSWKQKLKAAPQPPASLLEWQAAATSAGVDAMNRQVTQRDYWMHTSTPSHAATATARAHARCNSGNLSDEAILNILAASFSSLVGLQEPNTEFLSQSTALAAAASVRHARSFHNQRSVSPPQLPQRPPRPPGLRVSISHDSHVVQPSSQQSVDSSTAKSLRSSTRSQRSSKAKSKQPGKALTRTDGIQSAASTERSTDAILEQQYMSAVRMCSDASVLTGSRTTPQERQVAEVLSDVMHEMLLDESVLKLIRATVKEKLEHLNTKMSRTEHTQPPPNAINKHESARKSSPPPVPIPTQSFRLHIKPQSKVQRQARKANAKRLTKRSGVRKVRDTHPHPSHRRPSPSHEPSFVNYDAATLLNMHK